MIAAVATPNDDLTPSKAGRKYCLECCKGSSKEVRLCPANMNEPICPLWPLRFGKGTVGVKTLKAIREKCLDCRAGSPSQVRNCNDTDCPLWPYRLGHNPRRSGIGRFSLKRPTHAHTD